MVTRLLAQKLNLSTTSWFPEWSPRAGAGVMSLSSTKNVALQTQPLSNSRSTKHLPNFAVESMFTCSRRDSRHQHSHTRAFFHKMMDAIQGVLTWSFIGMIKWLKNYVRCRLQINDEGGDVHHELLQMLGFIMPLSLDGSSAYSWL